MDHLSMLRHFLEQKNLKSQASKFQKLRKWQFFPWYFPTCPSSLTMCDLFLEAEIWKDSVQSYAAVEILCGLWFLCFYSRVRGGWFVRLLISQCLDDWWWFNSCEFWSTGFEDPYYHEILYWYYNSSSAGVADGAGVYADAGCTGARWMSRG